MRMSSSYSAARREANPRRQEICVIKLNVTLSFVSLCLAGSACASQVDDAGAGDPSIELTSQALDKGRLLALGDSIAFGYNPFGDFTKDKNFQGFGRFVTGSSGEYLFRTIKPVPYPGRTPHIHYKVKRSGKELLVTQLYIKGHPGNEKDGIWKNLKGKEREAVTVDFSPLKGAKAGELAATFDLVLGVTPAA